MGGETFHAVLKTNESRKFSMFGEWKSNNVKSTRIFSGWLAGCWLAGWLDAWLLAGRWLAGWLSRFKFSNVFSYVVKPFDVFRFFMFSRGPENHTNDSGDMCFLEGQNLRGNHDNTEGDLVH